jgi:hypothetical protein
MILLSLAIAAAVPADPPAGANAVERFVIPKQWERNGLVIPRRQEGSGVCGDPCIVWDDAVDGWRMVFFCDPPGHAQAVCRRLDRDGRGDWNFAGPLPVTNPAVIGAFHKPFIVMDPWVPNRAAKIQGRYCLLVVSQGAHKAIYRAWATELAGPWTFEAEPILAPGHGSEFDARHADAVSGYYFAEKQTFLYFYMGYPQEAQPRNSSLFGSAQAAAVQKLGERLPTKCGPILEPDQRPGHWASGWVGGLQLLPGSNHRWIAVVNASPTPPDPRKRDVWTEEPPPSLGGFAWCDEEWPVHGWHFCDEPIEWIKDVPASALQSGEGYNLWRQFIHILPDGRAELFYNSGYYGREQLYAKVQVK